MIELKKISGLHGQTKTLILIIVTSTVHQRTVNNKPGHGTAVSLASDVSRPFRKKKGK